jgi:hypothetical protein
MCLLKPVEQSHFIIIIIIIIIIICFFLLFVRWETAIPPISDKQIK